LAWRALFVVRFSAAGWPDEFVKGAPTRFLAQTDT
jgi:hypothetical protein